MANSLDTGLRFERMSDGKTRVMFAVSSFEENKMPKSKIGDHVVDIQDNDRGIVMEVVDDRIRLQWESDTHPQAWKENSLWPVERFELVTPAKPKSPVVEETVKSIEPGKYGPVIVSNGPFGGEEIYIGMAQDQYTASELESAAKTFMELAAYLRDKE